MSWSVSDVKVNIDGNVEYIEETEPFVSTIKSLARKYGLRDIRVLVDGSEVTPSNAPSTFEGVSEVEILKYDKVA